MQTYLICEYLHIRAYIHVHKYYINVYVCFSPYIYISPAYIYIYIYNIIIYVNIYIYISIEVYSVSENFEAHLHETRTTQNDHTDKIAQDKRQHMLTNHGCTKPSIYA